MVDDSDSIYSILISYMPAFKETEIYSQTLWILYDKFQTF